MIKNIIFDFGDIFINLDKEATPKGLAKLGIPKMTDEIVQLNHDYEKGMIDSEDFINFFQEKYTISKSDLLVAWNAILLDFPEKRFQFLRDLTASKKYRLFLLSNTNDLHFQYVKEVWGLKFYNDFKDCFEQFYLSYEIKLRKPDKEIFEFVLSENGLIANETLFVDDLKENTDGASLLGIHVWNLNPTKECVSNLFTIKSDLF